MPNKPYSIPRSSLRVAAAQAQPVPGDVPVNVAKVVELIELAADDGVALLVFPEKFLSGYEPNLIMSDPRRYCISHGDDRLGPIAEVCRRRKMCAVVGAATNGQRGLSISSLVFDNTGKLVTQYHKQYLFSSEKEIYRGGDSGCILEIDDWRLGMAICYDSGFPEHARLAAKSGCHAYLVSALFSVDVGYHESRIWMPARALDNTVYVLMSNHIGTTGGWNTCGSSAIWGPYGNLIVEASSDKQSFVATDLDPAVLEDVRTREPMLVELNGFQAHESAGYAFYRVG